MPEGKPVTLCVGDDEISFVVTARAVENHTDDLTLNKKIVPCKRLLKTCVCPDSRETLQRYLDAGLAFELASALIEEFQGDLKITVKK
jgi:hypothetical protein